MIFQRVLDARPYPEPKLTNDQWGELAPRQIRLADLSTTRSVLDLNALLASDSTFFGDLFAHVVRLGPAWFEVKRSGDVMSRISSDAQLIEQPLGAGRPGRQRLGGQVLPDARHGESQ